MKTAIGIILAANLGLASLGLATQAFSQPAPSGGPEAKGNAPLKAVHTINDGTAKGGANSFTEGQARQHIINSGYASVSGLAKGSDGVWRGTATKGGAPVSVALDFKGNVTEGGAVAGAVTHHAATRHAPMAAAPVADAAGAAAMTTTTETTTTGGRMGHHHRRHHHHHWRRHHHHHGHHHAMMGPAGGDAAMSGIDRDKNGISDKEDRAGHQ